MVVDRPAEPARGLVTIAPTMKYDVRVVQSEDMSRSWKLDSVCLTHRKTSERMKAYMRWPTAQVETQLKTKDTASPPAVDPNALPTSTAQNGSSYPSFDPGVMNIDMSAPMDGLLSTSNFEDPMSNIIPDIDLAIDENFSWEMIGLGLEEPLPSQEAVDELYGDPVCIEKITNLGPEPIYTSIKFTPRYPQFTNFAFSQG